MVTNAFADKDRPNFTILLHSDDIAKYVADQLRKPENEDLGLDGSVITDVKHYKSEFDGAYAFLETPGGYDSVKITNFGALIEKESRILNQDDFIKFMYNSLKKYGKQDEWKDVYVGQMAYNFYVNLFYHADCVKQIEKDLPFNMYPIHSDTRKLLDKIAASLKGDETVEKFNYEVETYVNGVLGLPAPEKAPGEE